MKMKLKSMYVSSVQLSDDKRRAVHVSLTEDKRFAMNFLPDDPERGRITKEQARMRDKIERALGHTSWIIEFVK